ncbi:MAG: hypothetical protein ACD_3C00083G0015 [uncultured bacterium (gcode 4)]|uniref:C-methyltransferase domain-containing protein n=1 Tax=uncultured bacterium (gcode 4) TaxID=1234023 RepID=K2FAW9_9BACT|nr:MAG: hypothetical protein ACD_3C00083G0015 [uncultured bacterium (gcode 4)]
MEYINRNKSLITWKENLEHLYTFKDFPVFIWTTEWPSNEDLIADMSFSICRNTWFIQLNKVLPLEVIYSWYHSEALWWVWERHHAEFIDFVSKYGLNNILEIWGSNWYMAKKYTTLNHNSKWTIIEPNPNIESNAQINVIKSIFDNETIIPEWIDWIVHSHVIEHLYYPLDLIKSISDSSKEWMLQIFSVPNLYEYLKQKFTNCMNFEHTTFLTEYFIDYLMSLHWFEILEKKYFDKHSIFYATKKISQKIEFNFESKYDQYKKMLLDYIDFNNRIITNFNSQLAITDSEVYLFWAHVFSQYLLNQWIKTSNIIWILDNSKIKQWKRLYGSNFNIFSPDVLKGKSDVVVILKAWGYQEEIRKQLLEINPNIEIWE